MSQPLNLDPIKALCAAATPGPWCLASRGGEQSHDSVWPANLNTEQRTALVENTDRHSGDARFIAESRAIVPALVAEVERLRAELANGPAAKARETIPGLTLTDADVVRRAVEQAGRLEYPMRRVSAVDAVLSCGDGVAAALCRACGLDPDEMVGDDGEGKG